VGGSYKEAETVAWRQPTNPGYRPAWIVHGVNLVGRSCWVADTARTGPI
jgi:hypothetical protein